jgi:hypothetical protein
MIKCMRATRIAFEEGDTVTGIFVRFVSVVALACTLVGCEWRQSFNFTPESKINAAFPLLESARNMKAAVFEAVPTEQRNELESQFDARMKLRALNCAKGYSPNLFTSNKSIKKELDNPTCFVDADQELLKWLGFRRLGLILAMPALKPIPTKPPAFIVADSFISSAKFSSNAGIAFLELREGLQVVDIDSGRSLFREARGTRSPLGGFPAANGQVFATSDGDRLKIRESESGAVVLELPFVRAYSFLWIDHRTALYNRSDSGRAYIVDLATGREAVLSIVEGGLSVQNAQAVPGTENQYVLFTHRGVTKVELQRDKADLAVKLIADKALSGVSWASNTAGVSTDGSYFFLASPHLTLISSKDLEVETIQLDPFYVQTAVATADPDKIILTGFVQPHQGEAPRQLIYSIQSKTVSPIDASKLPSERFIHISPLNRAGVIDGNKIALLEVIPTLGIIASDKFVGDQLAIANQRKIDALERQQKLMRDNNPAYGGAGTGIAPSGPLALLARDAQVEGVGVYQGTSGGNRLMSGRKEGTVEVRIRRSAKPIVLVLSSYEPVRWLLITESGARLSGVLVSGYYPSQVTGAGSARVTVVGAAHAYEAGSNGYRALNKSILDQIGKGIDVFQGRYEGGSFSVGGT